MGEPAQSRPEWIRCVNADAGNDANSLTLCGRIAPGEWMFTSVEHAQRNATQRGRLVACRACMRAGRRA